MIRNIVFDIGAVLKGWHPDLTPFFGEEDGQAAAAAIWDSGLWNEMDRGVMEEEELLRRMIALAPRQEREIRWFWDHMDRISEKYDYPVPWIRSLKKSGYQVYYLSNYSRRLRQQVPQTLGFLPLMDGGVFSCDVKKMKPDPAIYEYFLQKYDLMPQECLFIDDRQENVDGAIAVGMQAIRFDGYEQSAPVIRKYLEQKGAFSPSNRYSFEENMAEEKELAQDPATLTGKRILAYGDSNTYGWDPRDFFGNPYDNPWPSLLAEYTGSRVISRGEPGREIPVTEYQIGWLRAEITGNAPLDWLIIMLGTNDLLNDPRPAAGAVAEKMDRLLKSLLPQTPQSGSDPCPHDGNPRILLLVPPVLQLGESAYRKASRELAVEYKILADRYRIALADASALDLPLAYDGVHLTEEGHRQLAQWLAEILNHQ